MKPVLFVTGHVPAYRAGALAALHQREDIHVALFGGSAKHGGAQFDGQLPFPHVHVQPRQLHALASSGRYRAVVCPTGGRLAPLATWSGAHRGRVPLILWASLWAHPRSGAHALSYLPLRRLYRSANAVVTYGPHVSAHVAARGARNVHVAPQSVDNQFWSAAPHAAPHDPRWAKAASADVRFLFAGRPAPEKGVSVLIAAWRTARVSSPSTALVLAGGGFSRVSLNGPHKTSGSQAPGTHDRPGSLQAPEPPIVCLDRLDPVRLREVYAACHVLVVPSVATRTFREPWGLVVNEAMNQGLSIIASDAVGAAAGGLVRDGGNGLIVPAGDPLALATAIKRLAGDHALRARLSAAAARDVGAYSHEAWADGFSQALATLGLARGRW